MWQIYYDGYPYLKPMQKFYAIKKYERLCDCVNGLELRKIRR